MAVLKEGLAVVLVLGVLASRAAAESDELDPSQDNPPGCTTATSESETGCGAQGRNAFFNPHVPPIEACADRISATTGSRVTRILPAGPLRPDGSLAFISGACVYLPPGYGTGEFRYPVLYLLHGGGGDQADWVSYGGIQGIADDAYAEDPHNALIVVMPDGRSGQWFDYEDRSFLNESYVLDYLIPYVDRHFRTIADRSGRVIAGLSNGGYGTLHFAAKAPDLFIAAGSMSGNLGARSMGGLGTPVVEGGPAFQEAGAYYYGNVPVNLIPNLDPVDLTIDWGESCSSDLTVDLCATWAFEQSFRYDNEEFKRQLGAQGYAGYAEYRPTEGGHAWRWWMKWLRERHLPFFRARLSPPEPVTTPPATSPLPESFRYRSIASSFSVFGHDFVVDRPVREFLDLSAVTAGGLQLRGSGSVTIVTAPRYDAGAAYSVTGTGSNDGVVNPDGEGRLHLSVDLGPAHEFEQYTAPARLAEAAGDYWTERTVTIAPAELE